MLKLNHKPDLRLPDFSKQPPRFKDQAEVEAWLQLRNDAAVKFMPVFDELSPTLRQRIADATTQISWRDINELYLRQQKGERLAALMQTITEIEQSQMIQAFKPKDYKPTKVPGAPMKQTWFTGDDLA